MARWTGAAATGYPRVVDTGGNPIPLTWISGSTTAGVYTGTYTIPAGWTSGFEGTWSFEFLIDTGRTHLANVQVGEHCLNAPRVYQVDTGGTRTEVYDGSTLYVGAASRMVIETGNAGLTLTNHVLDPATRTLGTVFNTTRPAAGTTVTESWSEAADAWDGRAYTSPDIDLNLTAAAVACVSDGTHRFWLSPASPTVTLPAATTATTVATVQTDACSGIVGTAPTITPANRHSILGTIAVTWNVLAGNEATGWPVQATPALANGMISDAATFSGTGWPPVGVTINVNRAGATTCPPGERPVAGVCQPCPDYQACIGGVVTTAQWCSAGSPPADATTASYEACVSGTLTTLTACLQPGDSAPADAFTVSQQYCDAGTTRTRTVCVDAGDSAPADAPCTSCPPGERLVGGVCEPCPDYQVCSGGSLVTREWCSAGNPPADATTVNYDACVSGTLTAQSACVNPGDSAPASAFTSTQQYCDAGTTRTRTVCVDAGDSAPADAPCTTCPPGERLVGTNCQPCPDYQVCSDGSLVTRQWCSAGNPPADATTVSYQDCVAGTTQTLTACLNPGESAPGDFTCPPAPTCQTTEALEWDDSIGANGGWVCNPLNCPSGQRPFAGICQPCPSYDVCSGGSLTARQWCNAGSPPADATMATYRVCSGNSLASETVCLNPGDSAPASAFTATQRYCDSGGSLRSRTVCVAAGGSAPGNARQVEVQWCDSGTTRTRTVCVDAGDSATDAPCTTCPNGQELVGLNCVTCSSTETYCSGTRTRTRTVSGLCTDRDVRSATETYCSGSTRRTRTLTATCIDVDNRPSSCASGYELNAVGCCAPCNAREWYCSGTSSRSRSITGCTDRDLRSATRRSCRGSSEVTSTISGTCTDADDRSATNRSCNGSSTVTSTIYGTCSGSDTRSATETYCSGSRTRTRTITGTCTDRDTTGARRYYCSGSISRSQSIAGCVDDDDRSATETYCSGTRVRTRTVTGICADRDITGALRYTCRGSSTVSTDIAGCVNDDQRSATETYCSGSRERTRTITGTCVDTDTTGATRYYCSGSSSRSQSIAGCVDDDDRSATETYCSGTRTRTRTITGTCMDRDTTGATETYCSGSSMRTRDIAGCRDRDLRPSNCPSGQELNGDGCCAPCSSTERYCSGSNKRTRPISGCTDVDNRSATETYCSGTRTRTRTISGTCTDRDVTGATRYTCNGSSTVETDIDGCVDDDDRSATETYCSGGSTRTRTITGTCTDRDVTGATRYYCSGSSSRTQSISGCVDDDDRSATETYCSGSSERTRTISGTCTDRDTRSATETYCSGSVVLTSSLTSTCTDVDSRPSSCSSGFALNSDGCCEEANSCELTPYPLDEFCFWGYFEWKEPPECKWECNTKDYCWPDDLDPNSIPGFCRIYDEWGYVISDTITWNFETCDWECASN